MAAVDVFEGCHTGFGMLSTVTYSMLLDELGQHNILHEPRDKRRYFKWVTSRHGLGADSIYAIHETLFVCSDRSGKSLLEEQPDAFMLITAENDLPTWIHDSPENAIVIKSPRHESLLQKLQMRFIRQQAMSHNLEKAILGHLPIEDVLTEAEDFMGCELALSSKFAPKRTPRPNSLTSILLERIAAERDSLVSEGGELSPIDFKSSRYYPITQIIPVPNHEPDILAAAYPSREPTAGQYEQFSLLAKRIEASMRNEKSDVDFEANNTTSLLKRLTSGSYVSRLWLDAFQAQTDITDKSELRLLGADLSDLTERDCSRLSYLVEKSFGGLACGTQMGNRYVFLLHSETTDAALSNLALQKVISEKIKPQFNIRFAASQVYENLRDTHFARREIELVLGYASFVNVASLFVGAEQPARNFYSFEDCFLYALVDSNSMDPTFKDFCLSHTILEKLYAEDELNGTENVRILIMYLYYARRASVVADKLHMHRNTVLYHIDKIQKRFAIDLEDSGVQERLMLDSKALFKRLAYNPDALDEFLSPAKRLK